MEPLAEQYWTHNKSDLLYFPNVSFGEFERRKIEKILRDAGVHE